MEIEYFGGNCFKLSGKKAAVVVDDNLDELGSKSITTAENIALFTKTHKDGKIKAKLVIDQPGEYEVSNISVIGTGARANMDEDGKETAVIFKLVIDDIRVAITGHIYPELSDDQLEAIGTVDVLLIPVGGGGYTMDGVGALKVIKKIEPKIVIPSHYDDKKLKYPVPQQDLGSATKDLAMEPKDTLLQFKVKPADLPIDGTQLVILERQ